MLYCQLSASREESRLQKMLNFLKWCLTNINTDNTDQTQTFQFVWKPLKSFPLQVPLRSVFPRSVLSLPKQHFSDAPWKIFAQLFWWAWGSRRRRIHLALGCCKLLCSTAPGGDEEEISMVWGQKWSRGCAKWYPGHVWLWTGGSLPCSDHSIFCTNSVLEGFRG